MRLLFVGALVGVVACGDDATNVPPGSVLDDPASSVLCTGALQYPNPPALKSASGYVITGGAVAIADLNGDGRQDIVSVARQYTYVYLRNADGSYAPPTEYSKAETNVELKVRDVYGNDGQPEIAFASLYTAPLHILKNNGDGTFTKTSYTGSGAFDFGDVDGGGRPDMVVLDNTGISVWNNAGSSFTTPSSTSSTGITDALALAVADLNGDARADAVALTETKLYLLVNNGSGAFGAPITLDTCTGCFNFGHRIELADVSSDGLADIVYTTITSSGTVRVSTLANLGNGTFGSRVDSTFPNLVANALGPAWSLGDLDGNGIRDVAVAGDQRGVVELGLGDGTGRFAGSEEISVAAFGVALGDVDSDGRQDLVTGYPNGPVSLFMGSPDGGLVRHRSAFATSSFGVAVLAAPGGPTNMVTLDAGATSAVSLFGHAADGTVSGVDHAYPVQGASQLLAMDANRDGVRDVVAFGNESAETLLYDGSQLVPAGTFTKPSTVRYQTVADVDGDSDLDIVVAAETGTDTSTLFLLEARGDGTFEAPVSIFAGYQFFSLASLDLDHDRDVDLLVDAASSVGTPATFVLLGDGHRSFTESMQIPWKHGPGDMHYRDFDGDGAPEIVRVERDGLAIWDVDGSGVITERSYRAQPINSSASVVGDLDGDGRLDVVSYGAANGTVSNKGHLQVHLNHGDATFADGLLFESTADRLRAIALGDVNGDGLLDIATAGQSESSVMYGRCVE